MNGYWQKLRFCLDLQWFFFQDSFKYNWLSSSFFYLCLQNNVWLLSENNWFYHFFTSYLINQPVRTGDIWSQSLPVHWVIFSTNCWQLMKMSNISFDIKIKSQGCGYQCLKTLILALLDLLRQFRKTYFNKQNNWIV